MRQGIADHWGSRDNQPIRMSPSTIAQGLRNVAIGNDSAWYYGVASKGYDHRAFDTSTAANWAFFPLHPLAWRAAEAITGEWVWSGVVLSNLLGFAGFCLLWSLARKLSGSDGIADNVVLFALFWPSAYFSMLPYSEALFLVLVVGTFLLDMSKRSGFAPIIGGLASAARVNGTFLAPALLVDRWYRGERRIRDIAPLAIIGTGIAIYMAYLWWLTGNPLAFKDIQVAWGRQFHAPWTALLNYINRPLQLATPWNPKLLNFVVTIIALGTVVTCWKRKWRGLSVFTLLTVLAPLCTGTLMSMHRYVSVAPGVFLGLAVWADQNPRFGQLWLAASVFSLTLLCTLFALGIDIGGA
jgi:Gpi18-like mannosyltransferase